MRLSLCGWWHTQYWDPKRDKRHLCESMWKLGLVSRNTGIDKSAHAKGKGSSEGVRCTHTLIHWLSCVILTLTSPSWSGLALEASLGSNDPKELSCHHQGLYSFAAIAQKKEKSKPNPQPSPHPPSTPRQHLASEKILKPYIFLLCSVTTLSFSLERKCSWEDIWRCLFFLLPWVCLWCLQTCGSGCPVLAWSLSSTTARCLSGGLGPYCQFPPSLRCLLYYFRIIFPVSSVIWRLIWILLFCYYCSEALTWATTITPATGTSLGATSLA